jgi:hypothetical protein
MQGLFRQARYLADVSCPLWVISGHLQCKKMHVRSCEVTNALNASHNFCRCLLRGWDCPPLLRS